MMGQFIMRFHLRTALFVASALLAFNVSARADLNAAKLDASKTAIAAFKTMAKDSATSGNAPRESDPAAKALLEKIFNDSDVVAKNAKFNDLTPLSTRMGNGVQAALVYMLAARGATDIQQLRCDPNASTKVNLNVIKFAPEMGPYYDFQLTVQGAIWEAVAVKLAMSTRMELANANFQNALAQIRDGGHRVIAGVIETLAVNGVTDEWRRGRLPALHAIVPQAGKILQPEQKKQLQELARACADVMDNAAVKEGLQKFAAAFGA
jgi:hypothetical protein